MKTSIRRLVLNGMLGLAVIGASSMQARAQEALTLDDIIARGLHHSARLAELEARQEGAAAVETGRAAATRPVVSAQAGYSRTNHVDEYAIAAPGQPPRVLYPDVPNNYRARLDLQWPIYTAGRAGALERAARAERHATGEELAAARADLVLELTRAFWALVTARETERVLSAAIGSLDAHVRDLETRLEQGLISPHELLAARAQRSRERVAAIDAGASRQTAEADLRRMIGGSGPIVPSVPATAARSAPQDLAAQPALSAAERPERRALDRRLEAVREREAAIRATGKPQLFIGGGYDFARPNPRIFPRADRWNDSWDASVNLAWTLWDGGRRTAETAELVAAGRALSARITDFDRQVSFEIEARRLEVASSLAAISAAEDGIAAAVEARRVLGERYRAGVATSTDVLDAEVAVLQAELDRTRTVAAARLAEARLTRAAGGAR